MKKWTKNTTSLALTLMVLSLLALSSPISKTAAEDDGPSASTKSFFGDKGGGPGKFEPEECKSEQEMQSKQESEGRNYRQEGEELSRQIKEKEDAIINATSDEQRATLQSELDTLTARANQLRSQSGNQEQNQQRREGPSVECKAAIVKMGKTKMATFASTITNNILPKLAKVEEIVAKVESKIPELKDPNSGVSAETISKLETNIASIKSNTAIMKSFFDQMIETLNSFISLADSDVDAAFSKMDSMRSSGKSESASTAADALVAAFTELETIIDELKQQGGSDGNQ